MAITLVQETGAGLSTANSYGGTAAAGVYFEEMGELAAWTALSEEVKKGLLIEATRYLDHHYHASWKGWRKFPLVQALDWPREGANNAEGYPLAGVPLALERACYEAARRAMAGSLVPDQDRGGAVEAVTVGPISIDYASGAPAGTVYAVLHELLAELLEGPPPGSGRARVLRT